MLGGTTASQTVVPEEWRNFLYRMIPESLNSLTKELQPHIYLILLCNVHALSRALYFLRFFVYVWTDPNDSNIRYM